VAGNALQKRKSKPNALGEYTAFRNKLMEAQGQPGTGIIDQLREAAHIRRIKALEAPGDQLIADLERFGGPVSDLRRSTLGGSDEEAVSNVLPAVMGSTWGGGVAGTVLDDPINALRNVFNPQRSPGLIPMVLGPTAKTAKAEALALAKKMDKAGASREDIWRATADMGQPWFKGVDGKWKFEIDDSAAEMTGRGFDAMAGQENLMRFDEAMKHDEFAKAYPDMSHSTGVMFSDDLGGGTRGSYRDGVINLDRGLSDPSTPLHEMQHAVQGREGFATGGSPGQFSVQPSQVNAARQIYDDHRSGLEVVRSLRASGVKSVNDPGFQAALNKAATDLGMPEDRAVQGLLTQLAGPNNDLIPNVDAAAARVAQAENRYRRMTLESVTGFDAMDQYRALAGEAEARAVQTRMGMSQAERAANPFWNSFDVPESDQIVRYGGGPAELTTYHGSPHRINNVTPEYPQGRFDLAKVGTGEGAQAYGHGIYLAESPGVAKSYKLTGDARYARVGGQMSPQAEFAFDLIEKSPDMSDMDLITSMAEKYGDAIDFDKAIGAIEEAKSFKPSPGHFYTVDLPDEHIAKMLDWDAPLSEQPAAVREALISEFGDAVKDDGKTGLLDRFGVWQEKDLTGERLYYDLQQRLGGKAQASEYLREKYSIPGIKYFDASSRAAGEGTRNFVVFDPSIAKILKRE